MNDHMEPDTAVYKTLLESTKAIPWKIDWHTKNFTYIGPQIEQLLGWSQASWVSANDWSERIHQDDREKVVNYCVSQSEAGTDHEADYRALKKDGGYIWIRDVVHVVRNKNDQVDSLVGFMIDISDQKKTEEKLLNLQKKLEELSFKDGLTGVANRRMFDVMMERELANARRSQHPLSVIMLDIDHFKEYNDHYGHIAGDNCLKLVSHLLEQAAARPRDLIARYGGEEFMLVLPETNAASASRVAERCRQIILTERIAHEKSPICDVLTISLGTGTIIPTQADEVIGFIEKIDQRLYQAKQNGRNCIVQGD